MKPLFSQQSTDWSGLWSKIWFWLVILGQVVLFGWVLFSFSELGTGDLGYSRTLNGPTGLEFLDTALTVLWSYPTPAFEWLEKTLGQNALALVGVVFVVFGLVRMRGFLTSGEKQDLGARLALVVSVPFVIAFVVMAKQSLLTVGLGFIGISYVHQIFERNRKSQLHKMDWLLLGCVIVAAVLLGGITLGVLFLAVALFFKISVWSNHSLIVADRLLRATLLIFLVALGYRAYANGLQVNFETWLLTLLVATLIIEFAWSSTFDQYLRNYSHAQIDISGYLCIFAILLCLEQQIFAAKLVLSLRFWLLDAVKLRDCKLSGLSWSAIFIIAAVLAGVSLFPWEVADLFKFWLLAMVLLLIAYLCLDAVYGRPRGHINGFLTVALLLNFAIFTGLSKDRFDALKLTGAQHAALGGLSDCVTVTGDVFLTAGLDRQAQLLLGELEVGWQEADLIGDKIAEFKKQNWFFENRIVSAHMKAAPDGFLNCDFAFEVK